MATPQVFTRIEWFAQLGRISKIDGLLHTDEVAIYGPIAQEDAMATAKHVAKTDVHCPWQKGPTKLVALLKKEITITVTAIEPS